MADFKQKLHEGNLPEEVKKIILEAWDEQLAEAREEIAAGLREELAAKYEHDREQTVSAMNEMISDVVAEEVQVLKKEQQALAKDRVKIRENMKHFQEFAMKKLTKELVELTEDRKTLGKNMNMFREFFLRQANNEIVEFRGETRALAEARVKVLSEGRKKIQEAKADFIKRASEKSAKWITEAIRKEFTEFRKEINEARKARFGKKLFEAMAEEFRAYHYNESAHLKQLHSAIAEREQKLEEAHKALEEKDTKILEAQRAAKIARDRIIRESKINSSLGHLPSNKRRVMMELLEDVQTAKLDEAIKKYLPMVLKEESAPQREKKVLSENRALKRVATGDRTERVISESRSNDVAEAEDEIDRIVYLGTHS